MTHTTRLDQTTVRSRFRCSVILFLAFSVSLFALRTDAAPICVALSGTPAPGGGNYSNFSIAPVLNAAGQVAFVANLTGGTSSSGIFAGMPGSIQTVARQNTAAPGGGTYSTLSTTIVVLNGAGQVGFAANTPSPGIFVGVPGSVQAAALAFAPTPAGGNYTSLNTNPPRLNQAGQIAFHASMAGGTFTEGIFMGAPGSIQAVALRGAPSPAGGNYSTLSGGPFLNGAGQVAFHALLNGTTSTQGLFVGAPGSVQTVALLGEASPAGGTYNNFIGPVLNGAGQVGFLAGLSGSPAIAGIFLGAPGSVQTVALAGTVAPAGGNYQFFDDNLAVNGSGQVAFFANLSGGASDQGLFVGTPGSLQAAALHGTSAPSGGTFSTFSTSPVLNEVGQVAFVADLTGPGVTSDNNTALYAGLPGQLVEVVREGNVIDVDPGIGVSNRTVNSVDFLLTSGAENGRGIAFNDNGLLVYRLGFTDGSRGIFTSQIVPEPSIILLAGLSLMGLGFLARRKSYERH